MTEFTIGLEGATQSLLEATNNAISVLAGCELFKRFVTRTAGDVIEEFDRFKNRLVERARTFTEKAPRYRDKIAAMAFQFIRDDCTVLTHSYSRSVTALLLKAAAENRRFQVLITEAKPHSKGFQAARILAKAGIPATVILDASVGYYIDQVDLVLFGAEGVVENGGLINQIGTYQIAVMSKAANKPVYAVAESYKFVRLFPLGQLDLPSNLSCNVFVPPTTKENGNFAGDEGLYLQPNHPTIDYTPPDYLTLLFTDLGVFTPSGVSDELIKLYY